MNVSEKQLRKAAKELNDLGFDPEINTKADFDTLVKTISTAIKLLTPNDAVSDFLQEVIDELTKVPAKKVAPAKKEAPAPKGKKAPVPEPEEEEEVVEDDDEPVVAPKAKAGKPAKETKPAKAEKAPKKVKKEGSVSPTYVVRYAVCENPKITVSELQKLCDKKGIAMQPISISLRRNEMLAAIKILKEQGQLK